MVTPLFRAITLDALETVKSPDFFSLTQAKRGDQISSVLNGYPQSIMKYLRNVSEESFVQDLESLLEVLGSGDSVIAQAKRLTKEENAFFNAILDSLHQFSEFESNETHLGATMDSFRSAGVKYGRVLDRELQTLLLAARDQDSPIIQVAAPAALEVAELPGVPAVTVQRPLLGGARMFYNGKLTDDSWRARLTKVLSVIS